MSFKLSPGAASKRAATVRATASGREHGDALSLVPIAETGKEGMTPAPDQANPGTDVRMESTSSAQQSANSATLIENAIEGELVPGANLDRRADNLLSVRNFEAHDHEERIRQAFAGSALLRDPDKLEYVRSFLHDIHQKYRSLNRGFVEAGNLLLAAQERLRKDYDLLEESDMLLPFSKGTASKLRAIAIAVRTGVLNKEAMPGFTHAYIIARMKPPVLQAARDAGLIRPDVRQKELEDFLKSHRTSAGPALSGNEVIRLIRERVSLNRKITRLYEEIHRAEARVAEIDGMLEVPVG